MFVISFKKIVSENFSKKDFFSTFLFPYVLTDGQILLTTKTKAIDMLIKNKTLTRQPLLVLLYTLLYKALLGFVTHPQPLGALNPRLWRMMRFTEVRAAIRFLMDGTRNPNFIYLEKN
jgi:hypothetical protein